MIPLNALKRRALGQHFLTDRLLCNKIVESALFYADMYQCPILLEIGPGKGALTYPLLVALRSSSKRFAIKKIILCEKDRILASYWLDYTKYEKSLEAYCADFLDLQKSKWQISPHLAVVSNLPYSSATMLLQYLTRNRSWICVMILMFQAEVAQRLRAGPSEKGRSSLSLWIQNCWVIRKLFFIPPDSFSPPPQVNSEVLVFIRRDEPQILGSFDLNGEKLWSALLKQSFSQRRQMLRRVLGSSCEWKKILDMSAVDGTKRAESLEWTEWNQLFQSARGVFAKS